jgi:hypothetical protein
VGSLVPLIFVVIGSGTQYTSRDEDSATLNIIFVNFEIVLMSDGEFFKPSESDWFQHLHCYHHHHHHPGNYHHLIITQHILISTFNRLHQLDGRLKAYQETERMHTAGQHSERTS